jgi:hypothetical protein
MRNYLILMSATALAACGGDSGPEAVGGVAPPPAPGGGGSTPTPTDIYSQFTNPVEAKTYTGVGAHHVYEYLTDNRVNSPGQQAQIYSGNASTVRDSDISITYDPRDAIFTLVVENPITGAEAQTRFQDPASRTDFGDAMEPQWGTPNLGIAPGQAAANANIRYLQAGDGDPRSPWRNGGTGYVDPGDNATPATGEPPASYQATSFFYEVPGTSTRYVTFAGYVRNDLSFDTDTTADGTTFDTTRWHLERGAFAYGALTANSAVPRSGTASYTGSMLGTAVFNPLLDANQLTPTYFQWMVGTAQHNVDFGTLGVASTFNGTMYGVQNDLAGPALGTGLPQGTRFDATASSIIDLVGKGGFSGMFSSASFTRPDGTTFSVNIAGSSINGAFYGPQGEEIGGGFRVVGGTPDERIDILGAFTGKK